jgi:TetR/AcrR family transcriptional regulator, mexJK operon transcriptional repressor
MKQSRKAAPRARIGRPPADEAEKLEDRLLDAAATQFLEKGYARTTMDGIARAANASTKTIYNRYANKGDILAAVIRRLVETTVANLQSGMDGLRPHSDPRTILLKIGTRFATLVTSSQTAGINRLVIAEAAQFPELTRVFLEGPGRAVGIVRQHMEAWKREAEFRAMPEPALAATIFYDMTTSTPRLRALLGTPMSGPEIKRHVEAAVAIFMSGCRSASD